MQSAYILRNFILMEKGDYDNYFNEEIDSKEDNPDGIRNIIDTRQSKKKIIVKYYSKKNVQFIKLTNQVIFIYK